MTKVFILSCRISIRYILESPKYTTKCIEFIVEMDLNELMRHEN